MRQWILIDIDHDFDCYFPGIFRDSRIHESKIGSAVNGMANHCHMYQHGNQQGLGMGFLLSAVIVVFVWGVVCSGCAAYTIRHHNSRPNNRGHQQLSNSDGPAEDAEATTSSATDELDIDRFYFPTDEGLREFQQILLRELGLTKVPDLSKVTIVF